MIIGRKNELSVLDKIKSSPKAHILALYGRRRIGKSFLIKEYVKQTKFAALLFEGLEAEQTARQIEHFAHQLAEQLRDPSLLQVKFKSWQPLFDKLTQILKARKHKTLILFDELQWMAAGQSRLIALIKYYWDNCELPATVRAA